MQELLRIALGFPEIKIDIKGILPWEATVRVIERMQHGRIFLAGDSAHQMPPWAGQGANSGIADAHNLAWKLAAVINGQASESMLETYEAERIPVGRLAAEASAGAADETGLISTKKNVTNAMALLKRLRYMAGYRYAYASKAICAEDTSPLGGISWRPWTLPSLFLSIDGSPGNRVPHIWVEYQGKRISVLDSCGKTFVLLAGAEGGLRVEAAKKVSSILSVDIAAYTTGSEGGLISPKGQLESAAGISARGAILVRPDDFVVWRQRRQASNHPAALEHAMSQALCQL